MNIFKSLLLASLLLSPSVLSAQGLIPTMDRQFEFCEDRPDEPEWLQNMHVREGHKRLLIQAIYRLQSYERVEQAGNCSCATLYPSWDAAIQVFNDNYLQYDRHETLDTRREFQDRSNALRESQRDLCEPIGHW